MKINKKKLKEKLYFNFREEVKNMGYGIQTTMIIKLCFILYGLILSLAFLYKLHLPYIIILIAAGTLCIPYSVYHKYKNMHDEQKWKTRLNYMEQMLSSFKRHPKLLEAFKDTLTVFVKEDIETDRRMAKAIRNAISIIRSGDKGNEANVYRNAAKEIEKEYGCHRLLTTHDYMEKVELRGGEHKKAADILLEEHALWKTNMEKLKKEQKTKRLGVFIVAGVCIGICTMPAFLNHLMEGFTDNTLYQFCSMAFLLIVMALLVIAENKLNSWWNFDGTLKDDEKVLRNYKAYQAYNMEKQKKKYYLIALLCFLLSAIGFIFNNYILVIAGIIYGLYIHRFPTSRYKALRRSVVKVLEYQYPQWMMELSLLLQTENVYVSLQHSVASAPLIIREEVKKLTDRLENETNSVEPYNDFFADLKMDNIASSMRNLYSIDSLGVQEESTLLRLIEHNNELMNKAEQIKGQEKINIWTIYMYLPLLAGGAKIIMDTVLLCATMISSALQNV